MDSMGEIAKQEPVILRDGRLQNEMVVPQEVARLTAGYGSLFFSNHAPNPKAARLFIKWVLGKQSQSVYCTSTLNANRRDVLNSQVGPLRVLPPLVSYSSGEDPAQH